MRIARLGILAGGLLGGYAPVLVLLYAALNDSKFLGTDYRGLTLRWLQATISDATFLQALAGSLARSVVVATLSVVLGVVLAIAFHVGSRGIRIFIGAAMALTFLTPPTTLALNLLAALRAVGLEKGQIVTALGQTVYVLPSTAVLLVLAVRDVNWERFEAAIMLGAKPLAALYQFVLREIRGVILAGFLVAMFFSLDDLVMGVYLSNGGGNSSVTLLVWQAMRSDLSPKVAWYSLSLTLLGSIVAIMAGRLLASSPSAARSSRHGDASRFVMGREAV